MMISAVVMAFNEELSLKDTVTEIAATLKEINKPYELIIIDDGSTDGTGRAAHDAAKNNPFVRIIQHKVNQGLGGVYRTGFANAKGDLLIFFPADGQFPSYLINRFLENIEGQDMVLGYLPERRDSKIGKALSYCERILYGLLFGGFPKFQGILMFRRTLLDRFMLKSTGRGWTVLMELILRAKKSGCRMVSVPVELRSRVYGHSKVNNLPTMWANLKQVFILRLYF